MMKEKISYSSRQRLPESLPEYQFGTRLKQEMRKKGITQAALARMMNVSESTVKDWCQHYTFPNEMNLCELCRIFAPCSFDYFHGNIDEPNYDIKFIMEYTGLSDTAVQYLHDLNAYSRQATPTPADKEKSKQAYREMFGTEPHPDFADILNELLCDNSGFTEILQHILNAERMKSEYDEFNVSLPRDASSESVREYANKQSLRELYYEKDKQTAIEGFRDFIESFLPPIR